jgi:hypothetical protein
VAHSCGTSRVCGASLGSSIRGAYAIFGASSSESLANVKGFSRFLAPKKRLGELYDVQWVTGPKPPRGAVHKGESGDFRKWAFAKSLARAEFSSCRAGIGAK